MTHGTSFMGRVKASLMGESPAGELEGYRRAGSVVYESVSRLDQRRDELKIGDSGPWTADAATQSQFAFTWNAFALQTLGDELLRADDRADPITAGYLPPVTARQAAAFYAEVQQWLTRANRAASDPAYVADVALPAQLPPWIEVEPCPRPHLDAMLATARSMRQWLAVARAEFRAHTMPDELRPRVGIVEQVVAQADTALDYADRLWDPTADQGLHATIEASLRRAIDGYYTAGQMLAMPALATPEIAARALAQAADRTAGIVRGDTAAAASSASAGVPTDRWQLTDPDSRAMWQSDPRAREAVDLLWRNDPDPGRTVRIQRQIDDARVSGAIDYARTGAGTRVGHFFCCPWSPVYEVRRAVEIGSRRLVPGERFTFDVSAEELPSGGAFRREILVADFRPTEEVDYCDLREDDPERRGSH